MDKLRKGIFNNDTTWDEINEYIKERIENPLVITLEDGTTAEVINLNPHSVDFKHLCEYLEKNKNYVNTHIFIIPHSLSAMCCVTFNKVLDSINKPYILLNYRKNKYLSVFPAPEFEKIFSDQ
jgi:hypothetical protein